MYWGTNALADCFLVHLLIMAGFANRDNRESGNIHREFVEGLWRVVQPHTTLCFKMKFSIHMSIIRMRENDIIRIGDI
jgi:hypothetical protein